MFSDDIVTDRLIKFIVEERLPYSLVESPTFLNLCKTLNPRSKLIDRHEVSSEVNNGRLKIKGMILEKLKDTTAIALTFDIWSARKCVRSFACVTAHFFDQDFNLREVLLELGYIPCPHSTVPICEYLVKIILEFKIEKKLCITTDNASVNVSAMDQVEARIKISANF